MRFIKAALIVIAMVAPCVAFTSSGRASSRCRHSVKLNMVGEIDAALNALPFLAGPAAALAAGQSARSQKKKIEAEMEYAEQELDEVKRKLRNADTLINGSFGLAVASAGFVAVQAFGGVSLPETTISSFERTKEIMVPSSSQQLAVENQKPAAGSIRELKKIDATTPEKTSLTTDAEYNTLFKNLESAGKAGGQTVETKKASETLSQVPPTIATATAAKVIGGGKLNNEAVVSPKTAIEISQAPIPIISNDKVEDAASKLNAAEKVLPSIALDGNPAKKSTDGIITLTPKLIEGKDEAISPTKAAIDTSADISQIDKATKIVTAETSPSKKVDETVKEIAQKAPAATLDSVTAPTVTTASADKDAPLLPSKSVTTDDKSLAQKMEAAGKAGGESTLSPVTAIVSDKSTASKSDASDEKSLAQKMEAAGRAGSESSTAIVSDKTTESKSDISNEKSQTQKMEAAEKAGNGSVQPLPLYDSLLKKIEAADNVPVDATKKDNVEQTPSKESTEIRSSNELAEVTKSDISKMETKNTIKANPVTVTPAEPSSTSTVDAPTDSSGGVYMKEAESALSSLGLPKLTVPTSNAPDFTLPSFDAPELNFKMPEFTMPRMNLPELNIQNVDFTSMDDIPVAVKAAAGVAVVGGAGIAIALSLDTDAEESIGSTMPIGAKKKGSTYLEGLSRSSTSLPNKEVNGSSSGSSTSYLNNLAASSNSSPQSRRMSAPYDFSPRPFDAAMGSSSNKREPTLTAVQESSVSPSFNFAPSGEGNSRNEAPQYRYNAANEGSQSDATNGAGESDSQGPSFNFSQKLFNLANKNDATQPSSTPAINGGSRNDELDYKPEPPMGGETSGIDWGSKGVDGGYLWRDPAQQKSGVGVSSYLDNLAARNVGPNPYTSPANPNPAVGSYNSYLDAMNRQSGQEYQENNQPAPAKPSSSTPRTGSYVDSL